VYVFHEQTGTHCFPVGAENFAAPVETAAHILKQLGLLP
jgi:hypothetical protein